MSSMRVGSRLVLVLAPVLTACMTPSLTPGADDRERLINAARKSGNPDFAVLIARRHVEENPDDLSAHAAYGRLLVELQQCEKAIPVLHRSAALAQAGEKGDGEHAQLLTRSYLQCQEFEKALVLAQHHEKHHPSDADMLNMRGVALDNLDDRSGAQSAYRKSLSIRFSQKVAYNLALSLLLSGHTDQSLEVLEEIRADVVGGDVQERSIIVLESLILAKNNRKNEAKALLSSVIPDDEAENLLSRMK